MEYVPKINSASRGRAHARDMLNENIMKLRVVLKDQEEIRVSQQQKKLADCAGLFEDMPEVGEALDEIIKERRINVRRSRLNYY